VQGEIESALAGINIIIDTIAPWRTSAAASAPPTGVRAVRAGPATSIEAAIARAQRAEGPRAQ
jgi:hypothetical protein